MQPLKNRKTPLQSKNKVVVMMNLFEKYVDEPIDLVDVKLGRIQSNKKLYRVDIVNNTVEVINYEKYSLYVNEPFE